VLGDVRAGRGRKDRRPAGLLGHPEHLLFHVRVAIVKFFCPRKRVCDVLLALGVREFGLKRSAALFEGVGDVLEEDQAQDELLVLG